MQLTREENDMLEGKYGYPVQKSMEIEVGVGECFGAERMIPVNSSHLLCSLGALGKGGILFLQDMADRGGKFVIHTDTNPSSLVRWTWKEFGFPESDAQANTVVSNLIVKMGGFLADTCTPYQVGNVPRMGEHIAWNESSAIIFANSVLGARTNREGGPSAVAAAIAGRVPEYGLHLDQNRSGDLKIMVTAKLKNPHDYGTLGYFAGKLAEDKVPVCVGMPPSPSWDALKLLGAGMATSGSVALYHVVGVTPEAPTEEAAFKGKKGYPAFEFGERELRETEESLSKATSRAVDIVVLGCPHASISEMADIARLLSGKRLKPGVEVWVTTSRMVKAYGDAMGCTETIEASGAKIICDICPARVVSTFTKGKRSVTVATDSAKMSYYVNMFAAPGQDILPYYGSVARCIETGITGLWR